MTKTIDMSGQPCPMPVIAAKKALKEAPSGEQVKIVVDNDIARQNLEKMAQGLGLAFASKSLDGGLAEVTVTAGQPQCEPMVEGRGLVVAVGRETLGDGRDDKLGHALMKAFIQSLTELDVPPEYVFFFNGGAFLTTEGSACLEDLAKLADKGSVITTCGACLNFYQLTDKLKIGAPTNMLSIVSTMAQAAKVINI
ncbi:MAG: sulfurtransferase-like selenium metabolism protein YedF [Deltaproteobacteria bacterium]|jgi:selenium metabolism protein YedF|nr:sulfurtransferase-like selenium metabolism protein YedF [Deltaproteobacteria bacterium]